MLVGWFLRQKQMEFEHSVNLEGNEMDFLIKFPKGRWLVECKMHRRNMEAEAFVQACQKDISKLAKKIDILRKEEKKLEKILLVSNWLDQTIKEVTQKTPLASKIQKAGIQIIGYNVFPDILHSA